MFFRVALGLHCLVKKSGERKRIEAKKISEKQKKENGEAEKRRSREAEKTKKQKREDAEWQSCRVKTGQSKKKPDIESEKEKTNGMNKNTIPFPKGSRTVTSQFS